MKQRRFRKTTSRLDDDEDGHRPATTNQATLPSAPAQQERKEKLKEKKVLLSFGDDEEAAAPPVKTSTKFRANLPATSLHKKEALNVSSTQTAAPGEYSLERLNELKKNTVRLPGSKQTAAFQPAPFKLSGSFKSAKAPKDDRFEHTIAAVPVPPAAKELNGAANELPPPARAEVQAKPAVDVQQSKQPSEQLSDGDQEFPDAETIRRAKAIRERKRGIHSAPDYISLGVSSSRHMDTGEAKPRQKSDSDSEEEREDELRMAFVRTANQPNGESAQAGVFSGIAEAPRQDVEEEDDESWAQEQIRKGVGVTYGAAQQLNTKGVSNAAMRTAGASSLGARPVQPDELASAGSEVIESLRKGLARLQATQLNTEKQLARTRENLSNSTTTVSTLQQDLTTASEKYTFMQELRAYFADACDMLQSKAPIVEELQDRLLEIGEARFAAHRERTTLDGQEEVAAGQAAVDAAMGVLQRGGAPAAAAAAAQAAVAEAEAAAAGAGGRVEVDEFGRDVNLMARQEQEGRAAKRRLRLQREEARVAQQQDFAEAHVGEETTDESETEVEHFNSRRQQILEASTSVFADADEEYASLTAIRRRLESWRGRYASSYRDAYMQLSARAVFAPFVRLELLGWDPIFEGSKGFDALAWYQQLDAYSEGSAVDDDLLPQLVKQLVLPHARHLLLGCWNPLSRRQTRAAVNLLQDLLVYLSPDDVELQKLLRGTLERLEDAVADVHVPAWLGQATAASRHAALCASRRFGQALRLMRNVLAFEAILEQSALVALVLEQLVQKQVLPFLRAGMTDVPVAVERAERVAAVLPAGWFTAGTPAAARPLVEFLAALSSMVEAQQVVAGSVWAKRLAAILLKLGDRRSAGERRR